MRNDGLNILILYMVIFVIVYGYICYGENEDRINSFNQKNEFYWCLFLARLKDRFCLNEGINDH